MSSCLSLHINDVAIGSTVEIDMIRATLIILYPIRVLVVHMSIVNMMMIMMILLDIINMIMLTVIIIIIQLWLYPSHHCYPPIA